MQWFQYFMESKGALTNGITLPTSLFKQFELFSIYNPERSYQYSSLLKKKLYLL